MADTIHAPFTPEQVAALNEYQEGGYMHPFTCGTDKCRETLVATEAGWVCPACDYTQNWAHSFMGDPVVIQQFKDSRAFWKTRFEEPKEPTP